MRSEGSHSILLTGGAGYIGSHVAVELQNAGYAVSILDRFSNSETTAVDAIARITGKTLRVFEADLLDRSALDKILEINRFDGVIHLAGLKAVGESVNDPGLYYRENLTMLLNLLDGMRSVGLDKLVFSSSATVYGAPQFLPYTEDHPVGLNLTNPYGYTKAMGEQILRDYATYGYAPVSSIALRYFNPIGAHSSGFIGENPRGIPTNLMPYITQVAKGTLAELQIFGNDYPTADGSCERDYIHVMDLAKAHVSALSKLLSSDNDSLRSAYNIGTGQPLSVLELLSCFERATGIRIPYRIVPRRSGDLPCFYADTGLALRDLGWTPEHTIEDACRDAWRFQQFVD